jgi:hypothetical protein
VNVGCFKAISILIGTEGYQLAGTMTVMTLSNCRFLEL